MGFGKSKYPSRSRVNSRTSSAHNVDTDGSRRRRCPPRSRSVNLLRLSRPAAGVLTVPSRTGTDRRTAEEQPTHRRRGSVGSRDRQLSRETMEPPTQYSLSLTVNSVRTRIPWSRQFDYTTHDHSMEYGAVHSSGQQPDPSCHEAGSLKHFATTVTETRKLANSLCAYLD